MVGGESIYSFGTYITKMKIIQNPHQVILLSLLALVFVADITTTQYLLSNGMGYEANPFMVPFVNIPFGMILMKGLGLIGIMFVVNYLSDRWKQQSLSYYGISSAIVVSIIPVVNNLLLIHHNLYIL